MLLVKPHHLTGTGTDCKDDFGHVEKQLAHVTKSQTSKFVIIIGSRKNFGSFSLQFYRVQ